MQQPRLHPSHLPSIWSFRAKRYLQLRELDEMTRNDVVIVPCTGRGDACALRAGIGKKGKGGMLRPSNASGLIPRVTKIHDHVHDFFQRGEIFVRICIGEVF